MIKKYFDVVFILQETDTTIYQWIEKNGFTYQTIARSSEEKEAASKLRNVLKLLANPGSIVVIDGYHLQTLHQQCLKEDGYRVVAVDDLHAWHHEADAILNHAPGIEASAYDAVELTRFLLGAQYALLRPALLVAAKQERSIHPVKNFLISMGAADAHNYTLFFSAIIRNIFPEAHVHLLVSSLNPNLEELHTFSNYASDRISLHINLSTEELTDRLLQTDVVICPASTISLEACAAGCTLITGYTADNQQGILDGLKKAKACFSLDDFARLESASVEALLSAWLSDKTLRAHQLQQQRRLIDGKSGWRIALAFLEIEKSASVRKAVSVDAALYFEWANDAEVRANSFQTEPIEWNNHMPWFQATIESTTNALYLYSVNGIPAGQMRLKLDGSKAVINYSVAADFRGQGLGKWMLKHIALFVRVNHTGLQKLDGWVKKKNTASLKAFESAGYHVIEEDTESALFELDLHT
jgi:spore coat polysaccharide biosynthesis predicted glycosyltransferase SpsG/RimJ/RimL family protein N-acetyltransferase